MEAVRFGREVVLRRIELQEAGSAVDGDAVTLVDAAAADRRFDLYSELNP
jgi:hypothetical protein